MKSLQKHIPSIQKLLNTSSSPLSDQHKMLNTECHPAAVGSLEAAEHRMLNTCISPQPDQWGTSISSSASAGYAIHT
jgi:hypothetical protein